MSEIVVYFCVMMAAAVGLELLYSSIESQIRSQYDALVCCLHWNMIQNEFKCIGKGEQVRPRLEKGPNDGCLE